VKNLSIGRDPRVFSVLLHVGGIYGAEIEAGGVSRRDVSSAVYTAAVGATRLPF
jgi:hypothetical protein